MRISAIAVARDRGITPLFFFFQADVIIKNMELSEKEIDELMTLARENHRMLRRMRRNMVWSQIFTFIYWLVILGVAGASYYYLQPYVEKYWSVYQSTMATLEEIKETGGSLSNDIGGLLEKVR